MTVPYRGRRVDPTALWSNYVEFPGDFTDDGKTEFSPLTVCPNPDHLTSKRHFQINLKQPTVHCFAHCGISGTYEHAIAMIEGSTHRAARRAILKHSRVATGEALTRPRKRKSASAIPAVDLSYERYLPAVASEYLTSRALTPQSIERWELGWNPDELRVVIPAKDSRGRTRFLIRRGVKPKAYPKYLYSDESQRNSLLFGICHIDPRVVRSRGLVLVEGSIDTILIDQCGFQVGGILGSYLSEIQARLIANLRPPVIYTMFDGDSAGVTATISVRKRLPRTPIKVVRYPKSVKDPDPAKLAQNPEDVIRAIDRAISFSAWQRKAGISIPKPYKQRKEISFG